MLLHDTIATNRKYQCYSESPAMSTMGWQFQHQHAPTAAATAQCNSVPPVGGQQPQPHQQSQPLHHQSHHQQQYMSNAWAMKANAGQMMNSYPNGAPMVNYGQSDMYNGGGVGGCASAATNSMAKMQQQQHYSTPAPTTTTASTKGQSVSG